MARKILLADDSVTAQNMGRRILSDAGYEVITVNNGSAALKKIAELTPDLIVLDVYMPGYGGLEVCQRLKESSATSRIPVLLTVGKLEPFKVEEARRVRADAHIVKPFDATELLAAIMRLEDKIVPQAAPSKPARSSKTETSSSRKGRDKSIDPSSETSIGWRKRLSIPKIAARSEDVEQEKPKPEATRFQDFGRTKEEEKALEPKIADTVVVASPENLSDEQNGDPARPFENFTVERLMAIEASAPVVEPAPHSPEEVKRNLESAILAASKVMQDPPDVPATPSLAQIADPEASKVEPKSSDDPTSSEAIAVEAPAEPVVQTGAKAARAENSSTEDEVMAALASLSPAGEEAEQPVTALASALAAVTSVFTGPRWIAEPVALSDGDSHLLLESEMEKAYAAFAAADGAAASARAAESLEESASEIVAEVTIQTETPVAQITSEVRSGTSQDSHAEMSLKAEAQTALDDAAGVSNVTNGIAASPPALEVSNNTEVADLITQSAVLPAEEANSSGYTEVAFAAAASAGSRTVEIDRSHSELSGNRPSGSSNFSSAETISSPTDGATLRTHSETTEQPAFEVPEVNPVPSKAPENKERELQLAAAWQNWRQIRESIAGPQLTSQIADVAAAGFKQIRGEEMSPNKQEASHQGITDASIIAGIVDSVFAELKPKLMEEIARKLAEERK